MKLEKVKISELGKVVTGKTPPTKKQEYYGEKYPFITPTDMNGSDRYIEPERFLSEEGYDYQKNSLLPKNSTCFVCIGATIGKICLTNKASFTNQQINSVIPNEEKVDPKFVYYLLSTKAEEIKSIAGGAATPIVNKSSFSGVEVDIPPKETQQKIASILSAFDDLIENNTRRIAILEEMARLIYREWFVHHRYPGHENDRLVDSGTELGEMPEGWGVMKLDNILEHYIGGGWGKEERTEKYPNPAFVIRGTDIPSANKGDVSEVPFRYHKVSNLKSRKLKNGDIVFEVSGGSKGQPLGRSLLITDTILSEFDSEVMCASFCKLMRIDQDITLPELLYLELMEMYDDRRIMKYQVQSTGISNFKFSFFLEDLNVLIPPKELRDKFAQIARPLFTEMHLLGKKNARLKETRDLLLPKLISGKIPI